MQKNIVIITSLAILATTVLFIFNNQTNNNENLRGKIFNEFQKWKQEHGRIFAESEEQYRFSVYQENKKTIEKINREKGYEATRINAFAHLPLSEFIEIYMSTPKNLQNLPKLPINYEPEDSIDGELPISWDWVSKGVIPEATYSGSCSSSYALQSANALSSLYFIEGNSIDLVPLSAQQLVSCSDYGCKGGGSWSSFLYAIDQGMMTNNTYPYTSRDGNCKYDKDQVVYTPKNAFIIHPNRPEIMKKYTVQQPITTMVYAGTEDFQFYRGGDRPFSTWCDIDDNSNYVVLITGFNVTEKGSPYWTIQTNMGPKWGNAGYMNIYDQKGSGMCDFNSFPVFPGNTR